MSQDIKTVAAISRLLNVAFKNFNTENKLFSNYHIGYVLKVQNNIDCLAIDNVALSEDMFNQLSNLLKGFQGLKRLSLRHAAISHTQPLSKLTSLKTLYLSNNQLTDITPISPLTSLTSLDLCNNQLTDVTPISSLTRLTNLYLSDNQLTDVTPICSLTNLTNLYLSDNQLTDVTPISPLIKLNTLYLENNRITDLRPLSGLLPIGFTLEFTTSGIQVNGNPLAYPPTEIIAKGRQALRDYFNAAKEPERKINEVKVLLVGDGGAGKTSLMKRIAGKDFDPHESQTHGINLLDHTLIIDDELITAHLWDFGGQEIMHATHQFFLSQRALYILVIDGRKDEKAEYWLKHIESFGGKSPVLVVINKMDDNANYDLNRKLLTDKFPNIVGFYKLSCSSCEGIEAFRSALYQSIDGIEMRQIPWPQSWFNVKTALKQLGQDCIDYQQYQSLCHNNGITNSSTQKTLIDLLNALGVMLYFPDYELQDTHVLEPRWVTEAVYKLINSKHLAQHYGLLHKQVLDQILNHEVFNKTSYDASLPVRYYDKAHQRYIVQLMKKFELCFDVGNTSDTVMVPDLLDVNEPAADSLTIADTHAPTLEIHYYFLPRSVLPRFMVKMHQDLEHLLFWRSGMVLYNALYATHAIIKADHDDRVIRIWVTGSQQREYLAVVMHAFREINNSFTKIDAKEKIPLPDAPKISVSYQHLIRMEANGQAQYWPDGATKDYSVQNLLNSVRHQDPDQMAQAMAILEKLLDRSKADDEASLLQKADKIFTATPSLFGFGVNLKALVKVVFNQNRR